MILDGYIAKEYTETEMYYSLVYGNGLYRWTGETVEDPVGGANGQKEACPLLQNAITGERFFARRLRCFTNEIGRYRAQILRPPAIDSILWPSDLVELHEYQEGFLAYVHNQYTDMPKEPVQQGGAYALLFPYGDYPKILRAEVVYGAMQEPSWKEESVRTLAVEAVRTIHNLNLCGYSYLDMSLSRLFVNARGNVLLDYSNLVYSTDDLRDANDLWACAPEQGEYPVEFMEPAYVQGLVDRMDFHTQNYALAAFLFYVLYGNYAYDGRLLIGETDDSLIQHYDKFRKYHQMPVFIFDENDSRNTLGLFAEDEAIITLWKESPEQVKELFAYTLAEKNAKRENDTCNPSPRTWLRVFKEVGWLDEREEDAA